MFNCDLTGCPYTTEDEAVAASMVQMQVMIPSSSMGLTPLTGRYCTKEHAIQALRELPAPAMILNPSADEEAAPLG